MSRHQHYPAAITQLGGQNAWPPFAFLSISEATREGDRHVDTQVRVAELIIRGVIVYLVLFVLLRNVVAVVQMVGYLTWRFRKLEKVVDGVPQILVRHGQVRNQVLDQEQVTRIPRNA
jgi:hypothetical protein